MFNDVLNIIINDIEISNNIILMLAIIIFIFIAFAFIPKNKNTNEKTRNAPKNDKLLLGMNKLQKIDPDLDIESFKKVCYELFLDIEFDSTKQNLEKIKKHTSNNLYQEYQKEINWLKDKNYTRIIEKIEFEDFFIVNAKINEKKETINTRMVIKGYDYVIDSHKKAVKGDYKNKHVFTYDLTFTRKLNSENWILDNKQFLYERVI